MKKGFTIIELLLVFSILAIIGGFCLVSFWGTRSNEALATSKSTLQTVLKRAKNYARDGREAKAWGVKKNTVTSYQLISGSPGSFEVRQDFDLDSPTKFSDGDWFVWFNPGDGKTGNTVIINLNSPTGVAGTVNVNSNGLIEIN